MFKPYEIVVVKSADYSHYGQVISRRTETGTYMVRMVPGDSSTMRECPDGMIAPQRGLGKKRKLWIHYAEVSGMGQFPLDMLRYDFAAPANFMFCRSNDDSDQLEVVLNEGETKMIIAALTDNKNPRWTSARWSSFLWNIAPMKSLPFVLGE